MEPLTLESARAACEKWQRILRLQDWEVHLEIGRAIQLGELIAGDCLASKWKREAKIRLLDPRDMDGQDFWKSERDVDWELTLVHELLHLHFDDLMRGVNWNDEKPETLAAERAIDAISKALVAIDRR